MILSPLPVQKFFDNNGRPMAGGLLFTYEAGTSNPIATYIDESGGTPNTNPIVLNFRGEANIWLDQSAVYKFVLSPPDDTDPPTKPIWSVDNITVPIGSADITQQFLGRILYPRTSAEIAAGVTPTNYAIPSNDAVGYVMPVRYGLVNDNGASDQTTILNNTYAVAAEAGCPMYLPAWVIKFTSTLEWDKSVDVIGESEEFTVLSKFGNFNGVEISAAGQQSRYWNFTVNSPDASDIAGEGIVVKDAAHLHMDKVTVTNHGGRGIHLAGSGPTGFIAKYTNISCVGNGGTGFHVSGAQFASWFDNIDSRGNTGYGFSISSPAAYHNGKNIIVQQNVAGGALVGAQQCTLEIYGESNAGADITLTIDSVRCLITNLHIDTYPADLVDIGTNNIIFSISGVGGIMTPAITRPKRTTNAVGLDVIYGAGAAGAGASPMTGGTATLSGGDADGTGNTDGGKVIIRGGSPVGTGREGACAIQEGGGLTVIGAATPTSTNSVLELVSTSRVLRLPRLTTTQKNAISLASADAGGLIYDSTLGKLCVVNGSLAWETVTSS